MSAALILALSLSLLAAAILVGLWLRDTARAIWAYTWGRVDAMLAADTASGRPLPPPAPLPGNIVQAQRQADADLARHPGPNAMRERAYWRGELIHPRDEPTTTDIATRATTRNGGARIERGQVIQLHRSR